MLTHTLGGSGLSQECLFCTWRGPSFPAYVSRELSLLSASSRIW